MKVRNALIDDQGFRWEFRYDEHLYHDEQDNVQTEVRDFRYRLGGSDEWLTLPLWATVADPWKITLCFFEEDEDGDIALFWEVRS